MHRIGSIGLSAFAAAALGQPATIKFMEQEPNDTVATATDFNPDRLYDFTADSDTLELRGVFVAGTMTPGDVDYFAISAITSDRSISLDFLDYFGPTTVAGDPIQIVIIDTLTNELIQLVTFDDAYFEGLGPLYDPDEPFLALNRGPSARRELAFGISVGLDIDPALRDELLGSIVDPTKLLDGLAFDTGIAHNGSFSYSFGFTPSFVPTPAAGSLFLLVAAFGARRER